MARLSLEEASDLAKVFGEVNRRKTVALLLFDQPRSKYDALTKRMKDFPKAYRISRATFYRKVDELLGSFFLQPVNKREFRKGSLRETVYYYRLSLKGFLAAYIYLYVLFLDSKTPDGLKESVEKELAKFESSPGWSFMIGFLKWHKDRNVDLSHAKLDVAYFSLTLLLSMLDTPKEVSEEDLRGLSETVKKFGLAPPHEPKEIRDALQNLKLSVDEFDRTFLAEFLKKSDEKRRV